MNKGLLDCCAVLAAVDEGAAGNEAASFFDLRVLKNNRCRHSARAREKYLVEGLAAPAIRLSHLGPPGHEKDPHSMVLNALLSEFAIVHSDNGVKGANRFTDFCHNTGRHGEYEKKN